MGAWGVLAFDNDDANDWAAAFSDDIRDLAIIESALAAVESVGMGYLEQDVACRALAACEVLARLQGRRGYANAYTAKVDEWVAAHTLVPPPEVLARAARIIDRIKGSDSEVRELWDDAGADEWLSSVADLRQRVLPEPTSSQGPGASGVGRRFELVDDDHAKYWEISRANASVTVRFGRLGTRGQEQTKHFDVESVAMEHVAKLILEKRRKGYKEVGQTETQTSAVPQQPAVAHVPPDGSLQIGPVQLPAGHQLAHDVSFGAGSASGPVLWISNEHQANAGALVAAARRVHDTRWVAFLADDDSPGDGRPWDSGEFVPADPREIAGFGPFDVLSQMWNQSVPESDDERREMAEAMAPCGFTFPGLAPAGAAPVAEVAPSGFKRLFSHSAAPSSPWSQLEARRNKRIGVVAAQRPADVITVIGWQGAVNVDGDPAAMSAVLRSWEDRFGAIVVEIGFDTLVLVVERPPQTADHAVAVAAEHYAFCYDNIMQGVGSIRAYASLLAGRNMWEFWWD